MLVAVIMFFVVLSFTGVAVLDISYTSSSTSMETVNNVKLQYAMESVVNESLWLINNSADSLINSDADGITRVWDESSQALTITINKFNSESTVRLDLSEDNHFRHGISTNDNIYLNDNTTGISSAYQIRSDFQFLPEVDLQYFIDNATQVYEQSDYTWNNKTFASGIHVFTGDNLSFKKAKLNQGTFVFTGQNIDFNGPTNITAPADINGVSPALVFANPAQQFVLNHKKVTILGAIYCANTIELTSGTVSGPVIARGVSLNRDFDFLDTEYNEYYQWNHGFGETDDYDWPKQVGRFTSTWG